MGIDRYAFMTYSTEHQLDEAFLEEYNSKNVDYDKLPVVFDGAWDKMHVGLVLFETDSIKNGGDVTKNYVVDPENVKGLLQARDKYRTLFAETFPDYTDFLVGDWRIKSFIVMEA